MRTRLRDGQIFTSDFIISIFLFLVLVSVAYMMWVEAHNQQNQLSAERVLQQQSYHTTSMLVRTPGYPTNWTAGDVDIIGLADPDHVLQDAKMRELDMMSTEDTRQGLGLSGNTNFLINVTNATGTMRTDGRDLVWGEAPDDAEDIATVERSVLVNATNLYQRGTLHVLLWR